MGNGYHMRRLFWLWLSGRFRRYSAMGRERNVQMIVHIPVMFRSDSSDSLTTAELDECQFCYAIVRTDRMGHHLERAHPEDSRQ